MATSPSNLDISFTPLPNTPVLHKCTVVSAAGYAFFNDESATLAFGTNALMAVVDGRPPAAVPYFELAELSLGNPMTTTTGHIHPDFGLFGTSNNREVTGSTTQPSAQTFISLVTHVGELHLLYAGLPPAMLRMLLAEVFTAWRQAQPDWIEQRRKAVDAYVERECLDEQTRAGLKERLFTSLVPSTPPPSSVDPFSGVAMAGDFAAPVRMGVCPSCKAMIPFFCDECPKCKALFGADSSWQVRPL